MAYSENGWIQAYCFWVMTWYSLLGGYECIGFGFGLWLRIASWVDTNLLPLSHVEGRRWYRSSPPCNLRSHMWLQSHDASGLYLPVIAECQVCFQSSLIFGLRVWLGPFFVGLLRFWLSESLHRCSIPTSLQTMWDFFVDKLSLELSMLVIFLFYFFYLCSTVAPSWGFSSSYGILADKLAPEHVPPCTFLTFWYYILCP
jgi:hypothetical protein